VITYTIDTAATFATALLMASGPRTKFGSDAQDVSAEGEKKWTVQAVVMAHPEPGRQPQSEVISVTITGGANDPAAGMMPGTPIQFDGLRLGVSTPEKRGERVSGGKPFFSAAGIRAAAPPRNGAPKAEHAGA
jgi:hypothetical protein